MNCSLFSDQQHKYTDIADAAYTLNQYIWRHWHRCQGFRPDTECMLSFHPGLLLLCEQLARVCTGECRCIPVQTATASYCWRSKSQLPFCKKTADEVQAQPRCHWIDTMLLCRDAMHSIIFSSQIRNTAEAVLQALQDYGSTFNAVHLRMEGDYADLLMRFGQNSFESEASTYLDALREHGCDNTVPIYVGSGVFAQLLAQRASDLDKKVLRDTNSSLC